MRRVPACVWPHGGQARHAADSAGHMQPSEDSTTGADPRPGRRQETDTGALPRDVQNQTPSRGGWKSDTLSGLRKMGQLRGL